MTRANVVRANASQARQLLADTSGTIKPFVPLTATGTLTTDPAGDATAKRKDAIVSPERLNRLNAYTPKNCTRQEIDEVRDDVVYAVGRIPGSTGEADDSNLSILYAFAVFRLRRQGVLDIANDLTDANIDEFIRSERSGLVDNTQQTYRSTLRRIRRGDTRQTKFARSRAQQPHTDGHWRTLNRDAALAGDLSEDAKTLLHLTGGVGLHANEVHLAHTSWITRLHGLTILRVPNPKTGEFREVPVYGNAARHLLALTETRPGTLLFRPTYSNRTNSTSSLKALMARDFLSWAKYDNNRARHKFLIDLLRRGVPFDIVCNIGGISPGTHLPTDLLFHMPFREIGEIHTIMRRLGVGVESEGGQQ